MDEQVAANTIHSVEMGRGDPPVVFLHGFGADSHYWQPFQRRVARERGTIAFDLPGHGGSAGVGWGRGAGEAAERIAAELDRRGTGRIHLCGHSLGGVVACVLALKQPERAASLTLLAPGGFGPEVNARLLRRFALAADEGELHALLEQFYGAATGVPKGIAGRMASERRLHGAGERLAAIAESFLDGEEQGVLAVDQIAALGMPVAVIWGTQDRIAPTRHAHKLPGVIGVHVFDRVGHSIVDEIPGAVLRILRENTR